MTRHPSDRLNLVADIGGTNTRVALADGEKLLPDTIRRYSNSHHSDLQAVLRDFIADQGGVDCAGACVAVAGPVGDGVGKLTNLDWSIELGGLADASGAQKVAILNDLQAQGHALGHLADDALVPVLSGARGDDGATCLVIGIGTGFNSALVLEEPEGRRVPPSESGHANMMVRSAADQAFFDFMVAEQGFAAIEDALSGRGLENIYRWLAQDGAGKPAMAAAEITRGADETAQAAMRHFVANLGNTVGNLALIQLPFGGIYMVGGVARAMAPYLKPFGFREHFIDKGRFGEFMERFSVHVIDDDWAALIGCAQHLASRS